MSDTFAPSEAAEALNVSVEDLTFWRQLGLGPAYIKIGPVMVRYPDESLRRWAAGQLESVQQSGCPNCGSSLAEDSSPHP